jgi:hypothetical protein
VIFRHSGRRDAIPSNTLARSAFKLFLQQQHTMMYSPKAGQTRQTKPPVMQQRHHLPISQCRQSVGDDEKYLKHPEGMFL